MTAKNVLIVAGAESRGYALAWKLAKEGHNVTLTPGNGASDKVGCGTGDISISGMNHNHRLADYAEAMKFDLTLVGPELPLVNGIVDEFVHRGLPIFGPTRNYARLEGSKVYSSEVMRMYGVPTPSAYAFSSYSGAKSFLKQHWRDNRRFVVKADGLHGGKGAFVENSLEDALEAVDIVFRSLGDQRVLLQERVTGTELSSMALVGGGFRSLASSMDYKRVGLNEFGIDPDSNTGGVGAVSPHPLDATGKLNNNEVNEISKSIVMATEMDQRNGTYSGVLYPGLMIAPPNPVSPEAMYVLEVNVRFGDPEMGVVLKRMKSDLYPYLEAASQHRLSEMSSIEWDPRVSVGAVIATPGYPYSNSVKKSLGKPFRGERDPCMEDDLEIFYGDVERKEGRLINSGGRVVLVVALGSDYVSARERLYAAIDEGRGIGLGDGKTHTQFRRDIAEGLVA